MTQNNSALTPLENTCSCGAVCYVQVEDPDAPYKTKCTKCGKYIYGLTCKKCGAGFGFPEDVENLDVAGNKWKCDMCKVEENISFKEIKEVNNKLKEGLSKDEMKSVVMPAKFNKHIVLVIIAAVTLIALLGVIFFVLNNRNNRVVTVNNEDLSIPQSG